MSSLWRIELLGWLRARANERIVTRFRTQQTAGLLAYLAYYPHHPHPRDERGKNAATTCWRTAFLNQKLSSRKTIYRQGLVRASSPVRERARDAARWLRAGSIPGCPASRSLRPN